MSFAESERQARLEAAERQRLEAIVSQANSELLRAFEEETLCIERLQATQAHRRQLTDKYSAKVKQGTPLSLDEKKQLVAADEAVSECKKKMFAAQEKTLNAEGARIDAAMALQATEKPAQKWGSGDHVTANPKPPKVSNSAQALGKALERFHEINHEYSEKASPKEKKSVVKFLGAVKSFCADITNSHKVSAVTDAYKNLPKPLKPSGKSVVVACQRVHMMAKGLSKFAGLFKSKENTANRGPVSETKPSDDLEAWARARLANKRMPAPQKARESTHKQATSEQTPAFEKKPSADLESWAKARLAGKRKSTPQQTEAPRRHRGFSR